MSIYNKPFLIAIALFGFSRALAQFPAPLSDNQVPSYVVPALDDQGIVTPYTMAKTSNLHFSNTGTPANAPGSVTIAPSGTYTAYLLGGAKTAENSIVTSASFELTGQAGYIYAITLPTSSIFLNENSQSIIADNFASTPHGTGILNARGKQTLRIGATFKVMASHITCIYPTVAPVIVNFN